MVRLSFAVSECSSIVLNFFCNHFNQDEGRPESVELRCSQPWIR